MNRRMFLQSVSALVAGGALRGLIPAGIQDMARAEGVNLEPQQKAAPVAVSPPRTTPEPTHYYLSNLMELSVDVECELPWPIALRPRQARTEATIVYVPESPPPECGEFVVLVAHSDALGAFVEITGIVISRGLQGSRDAMTCRLDLLVSSARIGDDIYGDT